MTLLATIAQLYEAEAPDAQTYYPHNVFFFAGLLLLPPSLVLPQIIVPHVVEMLKPRLMGGQPPFPWAVQIFNIAMYAITCLTVSWLYDVMSGWLVALGGSALLLSAAWAVVSYVTLNHLIVGLVLVVVNGSSWRASGVLDFTNLLTDFVMLCLGFVVAVLWQVDPWLIAPALAPLVLMARALRVPKLQQEAQCDPKTGLLNAREIRRVLGEELERARRSGRPLALIMADLDYLRTINNTYGHLAGDAVIVAIGQHIRASLRSSDAGGRFGGEEFTLILPNTRGEEALIVAERVRAIIGAAQIELPACAKPIQVTMSLGVAMYGPGADNAIDLIHAADVA
ncbi:GGDEF domain-containing protein, partial [Scytonema tolypothrichoides VB-61278]